MKQPRGNKDQHSTLIQILTLILESEKARNKMVKTMAVDELARFVDWASVTMLLTMQVQRVLPASYQS